MGRRVPKGEHPLKAAPHSGSSPEAGRGASAAPGGGGDREAEGPAFPHEQIAVRAYEIWLERGAGHGGDREDWLEAERQLREEIREPHRSTAPIEPIH